MRRSAGSSSRVRDRRVLRKACGPGTRCWYQVGGVLVGPAGRGQDIFAGDGGKTNSSPGRVPHKPSNHCVRECRVDPELAVNTHAHSSLPIRARGCGCIGHPAFPAPFHRADVSRKARALRAARGKVVSTSLRKYLHVIASASEAVELCRREKKTGLPRRFASRNDGVRVVAGLFEN
jgi:hypothetical protein